MTNGCYLHGGNGCHVVRAIATRHLQNLHRTIPVAPFVAQCDEFTKINCLKWLIFRDILLCFKNGETKKKHQILQMEAKVLVYKISKYSKLEAENGRYVRCCQVARTRS